MSAIDNLIGWDKLSWPKKIMIGVPIAGLVIGWMYYHRNQEAKEMHTQMIAMCAGDAACLQAVDQYSEDCFKENYHTGRRNTGVRTGAFVSCVNSKSGTEHFTVTKD